MNTNDVVEEIIERLNVANPQHGFSIPSILRKITQVRDDLIRNYGPAQQQSEPTVSTADLLSGQPHYPLPCPPGNVVSVEVYNPNTPYYSDWVRLDYRQFDENYRYPYYYFLQGTIGIYPTPSENAMQGLKIFHQPVLSPLTVNDLSGPTGLDPNYGLTLVFGVLKDVTNGGLSEDYRSKYLQWESRYREANSGWEQFQVKERW